MSRPNSIVPPGAEQPNVLHALTKKRAEIAGRIEHCQFTMRQLIAELDHVDATIRISLKSATKFQFSRPSTWCRC